MANLPPPPPAARLCITVRSVKLTPPTAEPEADKAPESLRDRDFLTVPGDLWRLVWDDEFDGNTLDASKWSIALPWKGDDGTNRHHNGQYASVIADDDIYVRGGALHMTTRRMETPDPRGGSYHYTEGLVTSSGKFSQTFGYFEMRAKLPTEAGPGTWPAFWLLTDGWPPEMDIIEYWGSENRIHQGTVTRNADGKQHWDSYHQKDVSLSGWHTFGLEWGPGYQIYNIDGVRTNSIFGAYLPKTPHYVLLNSGIATARPPKSGTTFPNDFAVDWVRVYARPDVPVLIDGAFESEDARPWQFEGEAAVVDYGAHSGQRCLRLDSSESNAAAARQTIFGLKPETTYALTAFVRSNTNTCKLAVSDFGGATNLPVIHTTGGSGRYGEGRVVFTTGPSATTAVIAIEAEGSTVVFVDDVRVAIAPIR